jgi:hypothetical protein
MFFSGVDLSTALLCPDPIVYSRTGLFSSGSVAVIARSCFRSNRAAKGFVDWSPIISVTTTKTELVLDSRTNAGR